MPWCPKCKNEYREGFTVCADCHVELVDSLEENIKKSIYYGSEDELQKISDFLTVNGICTPDIVYHAEDDTFELQILPSETEAVSKAMRVYFTQIMKAEEEAGEKSEADPDMNGANDANDAKNASFEKAVNTSELFSGVYEDASKKAEEYRSGALTLLVVGGIGILALILMNVGVIPVSFSGFTKKLVTGVMGTLFIIFLVLGITSMNSYKKLKLVRNDEQEKKDAIKQYLKNTIVVEDFDADLKETGIRDEILYFRRIDKLKTMIQSYDATVNGPFLDYIIEEVYGEIFE